MNEDYFVKISDPDFLTKLLLSSAKSSLVFSLHNQKIQTLKGEKAILIDKLRTDLEEIKTFLLVLDEKLPHKELLNQIKVKPKPSGTPKKPVKKAAITKIDKLNESLAEIERQLNSLS